MHHTYSKGDQLCPLGFHPQVRWPTRCKRCFRYLIYISQTISKRVLLLNHKIFYRDYKEHGSKRGGEDIASSSPSLSLSSTSRDNRDSSVVTPRSWTSSTNLSSTSSTDFSRRPSSWTSTPDLDDAPGNTKADISVSISLPKRRHTAHFDLVSVTNNEDVSTAVTIKRPPLPPKEKEKEKEKGDESNIIILKTDSLAERVRKMQLLKKQSSVERESSREKSVPKKIEKYVYY